MMKNMFLDVSKHLHKRVYLSVSPSVGPSVGTSVSPSIGLSVCPMDRPSIRPERGFLKTRKRVISTPEVEGAMSGWRRKNVREAGERSGEGVTRWRGRG